MSIFDVLASSQAPTLFSRSPEQIYYNENSYRLNELESYSYLMNPIDSFGVVRGNIILRALENKEIIEKLFKEYEKNASKTSISLEEYIGNGLLSLPYLSFKGSKVYVPVFPLSIASIYSDKVECLGKMPYKRIFKQYEAALIDPFDYYGYHLFISYFTRLVSIKKTDDCAALYDYDARAIYFVNDEGRLDAKVSLFDKELLHPVFSHLLPRIGKVVDAYFAHDKKAFIVSLWEGELISRNLYTKLLKTLSLTEKEKKE